MQHVTQNSVCATKSCSPQIPLLAQRPSHSFAPTEQRLTRQGSCWAVEFGSIAEAIAPPPRRCLVPRGFTRTAKLFRTLQPWSILVISSCTRFFAMNFSTWSFNNTMMLCETKRVQFSLPSARLKVLPGSSTLNQFVVHEVPCNVRHGREEHVRLQSHLNSNCDSRPSKPANLSTP